MSPPVRPHKGCTGGDDDDVKNRAAIISEKNHKNLKMFRSESPQTKDIKI